MGQPKKSKKKYSTPRHPWQRERIEEEKELSKAYGLKNKKGIWKMKSILRVFKNQVKKLQALGGKQAEVEKNQLLNKLLKLGLVSEGASFDDVLGLGINAVMERRLQTLVVRKGLARTMRQSRQLITHGHIGIGGQKITSACYLVPVASENIISFLERSSFADDMHPERIKPETVKKEDTKKEKPNEKKKYTKEKKKEERPKEAKKAETKEKKEKPVEKKSKE